MPRRTPWRPGIAPWTLKVHPGTLHGSFQGVPGSPTALEKTLMSHFDSPTSFFLAPLTPLERSEGSKHNKNQWFFNNSKIAPRPSGATSGRAEGLPGRPFWIRCAP